MKIILAAEEVEKIIGSSLKYKPVSYEWDNGQLVVTVDDTVMTATNRGDDTSGSNSWLVP